MRIPAFYNRRTRRSFIVKQLGFLPANWSILQDTDEATPAEKDNEPMLSIATSTIVDCAMNYPMPVASPAVKTGTWSKTCCKQEKEEENSMTTYATERAHLNARVREITWQKEVSFCDLFKMNADPTPKSYKELIAAITGGKYTLDAKRVKKIDAALEDNRNIWCGPFDGIVFEGDKPDRDGYTNAITELQKRSQAARDTIATLTPDLGLKALQDLEAWTPVGPAN